MLEAMSKGCVVIASDIPNHREIIQHGKNGFLFDYKNNNLVSFLDKIMNENSIDLEKISKKLIKPYSKIILLINTLFKN